MSDASHLTDAEDTRPLSEKVAGALQEEILSGRLVPGNLIRQEELAQRFAVSRTPVRNA